MICEFKTICKNSSGIVLIKLILSSFWYLKFPKTWYIKENVCQLKNTQET